jgi:hypothetical protein
MARQLPLQPPCQGLGCLSLIFLYKMSFLSFHVATLHLTHISVSSRQLLQMVLSLPVALAALSHQLCHHKPDYWWGGAHHSRWFALRHVPQAVRDASLTDKGPPPMQPDGVDSIKTYAKYCEENIRDDDGDDADEDDRTSSDKWVSESGPVGCFVLLWGPLGPWRLRSFYMQ